MTLPAPVLTVHSGITVVRDDLITGGTKARALPALLATMGAAEYVYASPAYGYAQVALAAVCRVLGAQATVFVAKRAVPHPRVAEAHRLGARIIQVPYGYLSNVQARARTYAAESGAALLPFGLDVPIIREGLATAARSLGISPPEVWVAAGSGTLCRALQQAWPAARFRAVRVGAVPDVGMARLYTAPEPFERDARHPPPFPSCSNYDAKAWQFIREHASPGAVFWNVAA